MDRFICIDNAQAVLRTSQGVYKQVSVFARGGKVFVPHGGGFVRVCAQLGDQWATSCPNIKITDIDQDIPGLFVTRVPRYTATKET